MKAFLIKQSPVLIWSIATIVVFYACLTLFDVQLNKWDDESYETAYCNVQNIPILGEISLYDSEDEYIANGLDIAEQIRNAEDNPDIIGIVLTIDSLGGSPGASQYVVDAIKESTLPILAVILESGDSAAYHIASAADAIIAGPFADVGSIGITMSYLDNTQQNTKDGLTYIPLTSAKYKDYGNANKPLTQEERAIIERDLKIFHDEFVRQVAENREMSVEDVQKLADGSSFPASLALEKGLIDEIGNITTALTALADNAEIEVGDVVVCE